MHPSWDSPERETARRVGQEHLSAELRGHRLAELRRMSGLTRNEVATRMGVPQAHISGIESGPITSMDSVRDYVDALGGSLDVVETVGDWSVKVA
ncbi:helix-turn-helix domain-containing protein [Nocardiopsis chromatogenes]|uniref:helix-turn-helix domain-containing protein n=1 Tax=Nocardiopsis chromatogenes TaxID=280239 RepID=UPI000684CE3A|nr:helix-turn-helix transcriptional regulator [Nocardiopsis chromatogenes]